MKIHILKSKKHLLLSALTLLCFLSILSYTKSFASNTSINDGASILESNEIGVLSEECDIISSTHNIDVFVVTTNSTNGKSRSTYLADYQKTIGSKNCVILLICMDPSDRAFRMKTFGTATAYLSTSRLDKITNEIKPMLKGGTYKLAIQTFLDDVDTYFDTKAPKEGIINQLWFQILISLVIGGAIVLVMILNAGGKVTVTQETYLDHNDSRILAQHDHYLRTTVTKTRKAQNNDSSSGGGSSSDGGSNESGSSF